jgi:uncharacterized membrane protein
MLAVERGLASIERRAGQVDQGVLATGVAAIVAALLVLLGVPAMVTSAAGALLGLALPGYALVRVMFPTGRTEAVERIALVLGVSISVAICVGFLLHLLPIGLSAASWAVALSGVTVAGCVLAARRDRRLWRPGFALPTIPALIGKLPASQLAMLAAAVLLPLVAVFVARFGEGAQPWSGTTTAWLVPTEGGSAVRVAVVNREGRSMTYRMEVGVDGAVVARFDTFGVSSGTRETKVGLPATEGPREVTVKLWRVEDPPEAVPYRTLSVSVSSGGDTLQPGENPPPLLVPPGESRAE